MISSWLGEFLATSFGAKLSFYPTVLWGLGLDLAGIRPRYQRVDSSLVLGGLPFPSTAKKLVETEGVKGVVIMNEEYETKHLSLSEKDWQKLGVRALRVPTTDFDNAPPLDALKEAVSFIESFRVRQQSVYVHCKAGRGRSGLVALCYVMRVYQMPPDEAMAFLKERRPSVLLGRRQWAPRMSSTKPQPNVARCCCRAASRKAAMSTRPRNTLGLLDPGAWSLIVPHPLRGSSKAPQNSTFDHS